MTCWLTTQQLADCAQIGRQRAQEVLSTSLRRCEYKWRDCRLSVVERHGRGGRAGRIYEVRLDSLPLDIQACWKELHGPVEAPLKVDDTTSAECQWRHALIQPALSTPKGSAARSRQHRKGITALDRSVPDIDRLHERQKIIPHLRDPPTLPTPAAQITSSSEADRIAGNVGMSKSAEDERKRRQLAAQEKEEAQTIARRAKQRATAAKMEANRAARNGAQS